MRLEDFIKICNHHGVLTPDLTLEGVYLDVMKAIKAGQGTVVQQLVGAYIQEMKRVRGITPHVDAIVANQLKAVFKDTPVDRAVELVRAYVNLSDPELAYHHWDLGKFRWNLQKCVLFLEHGVSVTKQQLNHAADPKRDEDAEALAIVGLIMERVAKDGRTNWARAKEKIGEIGWAAVGDFGSWGAICSQLTDANASTIRAQLRGAVLSRMKRGAERPALPNPENKHLPEPPADPARVRAIMAQAFNKKEIP